MNELLNPRYKIIADFPSNQLEVGTIINCPPYDNEFTKKNWCEIHDKYPHIYRKLQWFEFRNEEEMPDYLKQTIDGKTTVDKIIKWDMKNMIGMIDERYCCDLIIWKGDYQYLPATREEFLNQQTLS